jgi:8-oxo-dGTP pyrophosphatase MutT (NUDIX family)
MTNSKPYIICEISNQDFGLPTVPNANYQTREAARGIVIQDNKIALIYLSKFKYHKLPGGGVEKGETPEQAFNREIMEETGCLCTVTNPKAITIEHRDNFKLNQISHVFFGKVTKNTHQTYFDQFEAIEEGSQLKWIRVEAVTDLLENESPQDYEGKFIHHRDLAIWQYYLTTPGVVS